MSGFDGSAYQARFDALAATGMDMHGESDLIRSFRPTSVLDAGCGTGRVAIELARHGVSTVGVDVDDSMLAEARRLAPALEWRHDDLATLSLGAHFDVVVLAGNVALFCDAEKRPALVAACAGHVAAGGRMIAGFELGRGYSLDDYCAECERAGLVLESTWSTWDRQRFTDESSYAVTVHAR